LSAGQSPDAAALHLPRGAVSLPLALAAARGHCEVVDALMSRKAEVDAKDLMGRTALHHAAKHGEVEGCRRVQTLPSDLEALVHRQIPPPLLSPRPTIHRSLYFTPHLRDRMLLEYNATLNAKDTVGCTPLHMAAR
ncbi:unnamed protein product, partial [Scytosiphon promiscuus]